MTGGITMAGRVAGKMALVTGAAQGLGLAIAEALAEEGAAVALTDINEKGVREATAALDERFPGRAHAFAHDVTDEAAWQDVLARAHDAMGGLNILVNNAGIGGDGTVEQTSLEHWRKVHAVDLDSVFFGCKHALALMRDHAPGAIVNVSSIAGIIAAHNMAAYNSAKAAVWMLTKSVALHCAKQRMNIRCNSIHPTFIKTPILEPLVQRLGREEAYAKLARQVPLGHLGEPRDVAMAVLFLASDEARFITGAELKIDGGISAM
jgi:NAD(P)-dependent dehydrogenase (short-subunit alcohol dehydrogenase family)